MHSTDMEHVDPRVKFFDEMASRWDNEEPSAEQMAERLSGQRDLLKFKPGNDLLEVGCGTGKTTSWLVDEVAPGRVTALDFSAQMIEIARAKKIDAEFKCADVCADDLGNSLYDVVFCFHSFPHFRDQAAALRNLARTLSPGGRLIVMHLSGSERINHFHMHVDGPVRHDLLPQGDDWTPLLANAGLKAVTYIDRDDLFFLEAIADG